MTADAMLPGLDDLVPPPPPAPTVAAPSRPPLRIGSLCSGYGGLELGVQAALGGTTAWVSDIDKGACRILAHRFPEVPNIGDMTKVDWTTVEPVDVLCGGTPCQDLSHAGNRKGMTEGTRSNLWVAMREAIATIRPSLVIWENVGGAYSARADSDVEREQGLLGDFTGRPPLRALGRVLGDLASLRYMGGWHGLRAADVGAPHGRFRVFVVAQNTDLHDRRPRLSGTIPPDRPGPEIRPPGPDHGPPPDPQSGAASDTIGGPLTRAPAPWSGKGDLLPTPTGDDASNLTRDSGDFQSLTRTVTHLLPTPLPTHDLGNTEQPEEWRHRRADVYRRTGTRHGPALSVILLSILEGRPLTPENYMPDEDDDPTWTPPVRPASALESAPSSPPISWSSTSKPPSPSMDGSPPASLWRPSTARSPKPGPDRLFGTLTVAQRHRSPEFISVGRTPLEFIEDDYDGTWGPYGPAITRWERTLGRPAPAPTEKGPLGDERLSPGFTEWMMGLPPGWVTDVPEISRNQALAAIGNGVIPQQAEAAIRILVTTLMIGTYQ